MTNTLLCILFGLLCTATPCVCQSGECAPSDEHSGASLIQRGHNIHSVTGHVNEENATTPAPHELAQKETVNRVQNQGAAQQHLSLARLASRSTARGFCRSHPCSLLLSEDDKRRGVGSTASLTEDGYREVAKLKDDKEMKNFIVRVIENYDCKVDDVGGMMGFVPWFSGTSSTQSFAQLEDALLFAVLADGKPWISYRNTAGITGANAKLNLQGYVEVACVRNDQEMRTFAKRICTNLEIKIIDEGGFEGMIKYFSGAATFQSFDSLVSELKAAAKAPHSWAVFK